MKDFKEILEKIAKENGTTPENVLQEMQRAIDEAYDHHDGSAQPLWDMMTVKAKLFCPEIAGLFCRIAGLFCHDSRANLSLKPVCFGIAIS